MPAFAQRAIDAIKNNKIVVALIVAVAAGVDYAFGLGVSEHVIALFSNAP
jgi:hypothetical protein